MRANRCIRTPARQRGFSSMVAMALALLVAIAMLSVYLGIVARQRLRHEASIAGHNLEQYTNGVRQWVSANAGNMTITTASYTGANWLKSPNCGGPASNPSAGYLPCAFQASTPFLQSYTTAVTRNGTQLTAVTTLSRVDLPTPVKDGYVANLIADAAEAVPGSLASPAQGTFQIFAANDPAHPLSTTSPKWGTVTATVSNAASLDAWLRTDGSNSMQAALNMNDNDILGAKNIQGSGDLVMGGNVASVNGNIAADSGSVVANRNVTSNNGNLVARNGGVTSFGDVYSENGDLLAPNGNILTKNVRISSVDVNGVGGIQPTMAQAVFDVRDVSNGVYVNKPLCPAGTAPQIFLAMRSFPLSGEKAIEGVAIDSGSQWYIRAHYLNSSGNWIYLAPGDVRMIATMKCS